MGRIIDTPQVEDRIAAGLTIEEIKALKASAQTDIAKVATEAELRGHRLGEERAYREGVQKMADLLAEFQGLLAIREPMLVDVVIEAVKSIIGEVPAQERIQALVKRALSEIVDIREVTVKAPTDDAVLIRSALSALTRQDSYTQFKVEVDSLLKNGELQLVMSTGNMHIGEERQLGRLSAALRRSIQPL
jgi:flagellar biosynthesis/type III secretory pathway protein FliH